ncbi:MAG: hypothetical protein JNM27_00285 [Leptospirales bacterium]|nr:hypothetical protein [Leptospirales bacterium]
MTAAGIEREIRLISERLVALNNKAPEMSGMDWARDHGWISENEWESAEEQSKNGVRLQEAELEKIETLRRKHPEPMTEFLTQYIDRLKNTQQNLNRMAAKAAEQKIEFSMQFNRHLLVDIIACLEGWKNKRKTKHWPAWMWRVVFSVNDESERFIEKSGG